MADISVIRLDDTDYTLEDSQARRQLTALQTESGAMAAVESLDLLSLTGCPRRPGIVLLDGTWGQLTGSTAANYRHAALPVRPGDSLTLTGNGELPFYFAVLTDYQPPAEADQGQPVPLSAAEGFNARLTLSPNASLTYVLPGDARYLVLMTLWGGTDDLPGSMTLNGRDLLSSAGTKMGTMQETLDGHARSLSSLQSVTEIGLGVSGGHVPFRPGTVTQNIGEEARYQAPGSTVLRQVTGLLCFPFDLWLTVSEGFRARLVYVDENNLVTAITPYQTHRHLAVPADTRFYIVLSAADQTEDISSLDGSACVTLLNQLYENEEQQALEQMTSVGLSKAGGHVPFTPGNVSQNIGQEAQYQAPGTTVIRQATGLLCFPFDLWLTVSEGFRARLVYVDDSNIVTSYTPYQKHERLQVPAGTQFYIVLSATDQSQDISSVDGSACVTLVSRLFDDKRPDRRWLALGDSITQGYYSFFTEESTPKNPRGKSAVNSALTWTGQVQKRLCWELDNRAIGGTGFIHWQGGGRTADMAGFRLARSLDFRGFDVVTVAFGINDWKGNQELGTLSDSYGTLVSTDPETGLSVWDGEPNTIYGGIKAVIAAVMASNPMCKLILLTPLNALGYYSTAVDGYAYKNSERYARTYTYQNSGTLEDVYQAIVDVCEYYGVQYIDLTHASFLNLFNMETALPDGVHPSLEAHTLLANELIMKLTN